MSDHKFDPFFNDVGCDCSYCGRALIRGQECPCNAERNIKRAALPDEFQTATPAQVTHSTLDWHPALGTPRTSNASQRTLVDRVFYGGRKGRNARRRLFAMGATHVDRHVVAFGPTTIIIEQLVPIEALNNTPITIHQVC